MTFLQKLLLLLQSRKFWALVLSIVTAVGAHATGQIDSWQMVQTIIVALSVYSAAIAYVDAGYAKPATPPKV
jgi:hypothetical protein